MIPMLLRLDIYSGGADSGVQRTTRAAPSSVTYGIIGTATSRKPLQRPPPRRPRQSEPAAGGGRARADQRLAVLHALADPRLDGLAHHAGGFEGAEQVGVLYLVIDRHVVDCEVVRICPASSLLSRA